MKAQTWNPKKALTKRIDSGGQGSLVCCSLWGRKESDTTERLNITWVINTYLIGPWIALIGSSIHSPIT